jgi:hypothetical protein
VIHGHDRRPSPYPPRRRSSLWYLRQISIFSVRSAMRLQGSGTIGGVCCHFRAPVRGTRQPIQEALSPNHHAGLVKYALRGKSTHVGILRAAIIEHRRKRFAQPRRVSRGTQSLLLRTISRAIVLDLADTDPQQPLLRGSGQAWCESSPDGRGFIPTQWTAFSGGAWGIRVEKEPHRD